ncbi:MAG TPA: restriction endonuclease subunit S [Puia sp.]|jgi:type I restriction enzyme S subunit|nr:restriction endonuclease subunit S [Puia sp.]
MDVLDDIRVEKYAAYKDSGVEWLGEIPEHWTVKRLKYVFKILKRIAGKLGHNVLSITQDGIKIKDTESGEGQLSMDYSKYQFVYEGDFAMNHMDLLTGYVDISKYPGVISPDYRVFELIEANSNKQYMLLLLQLGYKNKIFYAYGQGVSMLGRWRFPAENFNDFLFPVPPLEEQAAIAKFIDRRTTLIDKTIAIEEQQIDLLKEYRQILIQRAVTRGLDPNVRMKDSGLEWIGEIPEHWKVKRLKNLCFINLETLPENTNKNLELKYVDIGNVTLENGIVQPEDYIFNDAPSRARRIAKKGDTVISTVRTYLKAIDFIDETKSTYIYSTGFAVLQPKEFVYPEFLAFYVRSDAFTDQVMFNSKGVSYPAINSIDLGRIFVLQCSMEEQKEIVLFITMAMQKITSTISLKEREIEKLKEYKTTLINSAVTGKIKVCPE